MTEFEQQTLILQEWSNWTTIVGAAATFFVSFVALFVALCGERLRQWWRKPKLTISLCEPNRNVARGGRSNIEQKRWYYLMSVRNSKPSAPSENVGVFLTGVFKRRTDGCWKKQKLIETSCQVHWSFPNQRSRRETIGHNCEIACFGYVAEDTECWCMELYSTPNNLTPWVAPNDPTRLEFEAIGVNARSEPLVVEIAWDGQWVEGQTEMQQHCVVKEVTQH